ncbi:MULTISPECIES: class I SAM-dependent methyltransferase [Actinomycetaceae]|uniref:class I SAM-dependent methyltransferase n=1 Tax=Actinomycetaceae TaxID=2049 RepID=UPI0003979971|nr:methyltransferase [Actinobaculum sp. oral taxon 183]ERH17090.1 methyltransferase small domain protein [Actinobaculum sp. oral taxon 183 str. F0552]RKV68342.1 MAG: methyltransferase domain-containing protein [Actinomyces sp.]
MSTPHYFSEGPAGEAQVRERTVRLRDRQYGVVTSSGVFSADRLDRGTAVLLSRVPAPAVGEGDLAVDVGCGWGPVTLALAAEAPAADVWGVDVNARARDLTRENLRRAGLTASVLSPDEAFAALDGRRIRLIWSNPPVRIGKPALHALLDSWIERLADDGAAYLVVQRNLGADSLHRWMAERGWGCERVASSKGYRVLSVRRRG